MANGFSLGVLQFQRDITKNATPQYKVDPYGFLASLYAAHSRGVIMNSSGGHIKTVKVKRKKRLVESQIRSAAECDNVVQPPTVEDTVTITGYREVGVSVPDATIVQFDEYASKKVRLGDQGSELMYEFWDSVQTAANAILQAVDNDLVVKAVAAVGRNARSGNTGFTDVINIALNTTNNPLANGPTQIFSDFKQNSFYGSPIVVGAGLFHNYMMQQPAKGVDQSGVNTRILTNAFDFWYDLNIDDNVAGDNNIIVYEKDAVQIIEHMQFVGPFAGTKGLSTFGTLTLPFITGEQLIPIQFDYQLRYNDCPVTMTVDGYTDQTVGRGWQIIISKTFDLYTIPTDAYQGSDRLTGNRGSIGYNVTNV